MVPSVHALHLPHAYQAMTVLLFSADQAPHVVHASLLHFLLLLSHLLPEQTQVHEE